MIGFYVPGALLEAGGGQWGGVGSPLASCPWGGVVGGEGAGEVGCEDCDGGFGGLAFG